MSTQPNKEAVRKFMQQRQKDRTPPPSPEEIRRQLGWGLIAAQRSQPVSNWFPCLAG
jgi:hypothetical protein